MFRVGEFGNLACPMGKNASDLKMKCAAEKTLFCAAPNWLVDAELLSPDCLQSNKQQILDNTDSCPTLRAARQQDAAQPPSPSKWGLTPANELMPTEATKPTMSSNLNINSQSSLTLPDVSIEVSFDVRATDNMRCTTAQREQQLHGKLFVLDLGVSSKV